MIVEFHVFLCEEELIVEMGTPRMTRMMLRKTSALVKGLRG